MKIIKKAGIIAGSIAGCAIGGTLSLTGKLTNIKPLDSLGQNIFNSFLYTGEIAGELISGASDITLGKIKKDEIRFQKGKTDLKTGGEKIIKNYISNFRLIGHGGAEIATGVLKHDKVRVIKGSKRLVKIFTVGILTVGAIKIEDDEENENKNQKIQTR